VLCCLLLVFLTINSSLMHNRSTTFDEISPDNMDSRATSNTLKIAMGSSTMDLTKMEEEGYLVDSKPSASGRSTFIGAKSAEKTPTVMSTADDRKGESEETKLLLYQDSSKDSLLRQASSSIKLRESVSALKVTLTATSKPHRQSVSLLDNSDETTTDVKSLGERAQEGDLVAVKKYVEDGVSMSAASGQFKRTALIRAAMHGRTNVLGYMVSKLPPQLLDDVDSEGRSALSWAAYNNHPECVELLVTANADIDTKDEEKDTPLILAARSGHKEVVNYLIDNKADVNIKGYCKKTALEQAQARNMSDIVKILSEAQGSHHATQRSQKSQNISGRSNRSNTSDRRYDCSFCRCS